MNVILLEPISNLGNLGDTVTVTSGYGRNFLIPFGKAVPASKDNIKAFESRRLELEQSAIDKLKTAKKRASDMAEIELTLTAKAGDEGKLFGSIGLRDLAEAITSAGFSVAKNEIRIKNGPIRTIGEYDIVIRLHTNISTTIKIFVKAE